MPTFTWDIDPVLLSIFSWEIRYYSLIFVAVFLGGYSLLNWQIKRGGGDEEAAGDFIFYGVLGVLIGARLGHVAFYDLDKALEDPLWVFRIWEGGLASHGAAIGLAVSMFLFTRKKGVSFIEGADRFAFSAALGAALVRLGNFFNSEIVGRAVEGQAWGVRFPRYEQHPVLRHPSQLYEFAMGLVILGALWLFDRSLGREKRPRGAMVSAFFLLYFTGRFLVEFVKEYQTLPMGSVLTMGQWLSLPEIALGLFGLALSFKRRVPAGWASEDDLDEEELDEDDLELVEPAEPTPGRAAAAPALAASASASPGRLVADTDVNAEFGGSEEERQQRAARLRKELLESEQD